MECRPGCGACCIAPSISSAIPGMPRGKPAGVRCLQLTEENLCALFGHPARPAVCLGLKPEEEMCRGTTEEAYTWLEDLEEATRPGSCAYVSGGIG
jgi:Fe-S-cluster containining protein